jgi:hypothetical protein
MHWLDRILCKMCRPRLHYLPPKLSTLPCLNPYETFFLLCFWCKKFEKKGFQASASSPTYTARFLKTTLVHWTLIGFQSFALVPSTLTCVTIIFQACEKWTIKIFPVGTKDQIADALTKALPQNDFQQHHHYMCGL